jgi:hypothetical protein
MKIPHRPVVVTSSRLILVVTLVVAYIPSSSLALLGFNAVHQHQQHRQQQPFTFTSASVHPSPPLRQRRRHLCSSKSNNQHCHDAHDHDDELSSSSHLNNSSSSPSSLDMNRRLAFEQISGKALSSLLLSSTILNAGPLLLLPPAHAAAATSSDVPPDYDDTIKKRILITGCNSGIGFDAAQRMVVRGHEVVLACVSVLLSRVVSLPLCSVCMVVAVSFVQGIYIYIYIYILYIYIYIYIYIDIIDCLIFH